MMKNICKSTILGLLAFSLLQTSCKEEFEYTPAALEKTGNVFIADNPYNRFGYSNNDPLTFTIKLQRYDVKAKETIKLISDNNKITIPEVTFEAGEKIKLINVPFTAPEASTTIVNVSVAPESASPYGPIHATYELEHYKVHKVDYESGWLRNTFNNLQLLESGNKHYKLYVPLKGLDGEEFYPITFDVNDKNEVYIHPVPIYTDKDGTGNPHLLYIIGNKDLKACDGKNGIFNDADINAHNHMAGMYDPQSGTFELTVLWYAPNFGWWNFSKETIACVD